MVLATKNVEHHSRSPYLRTTGHNKIPTDVCFCSSHPLSAKQTTNGKRQNHREPGAMLVWLLAFHWAVPDYTQLNPSSEFSSRKQTTYHLLELGHLTGNCLHWQYFHLRRQKAKVYEVSTSLRQSPICEKSGFPAIPYPPLSEKITMKHNQNAVGQFF